MEYSLAENEPHPSALTAFVWLKRFQLEHFTEWAMLVESIHSSALSDNRTAQILSSTLERLENGQPVSDRYLLGLVWFVVYSTPFHKK